MLPFRGDVIHARWSGEAIWSPLSTVWPNASTLEREHATGHPKPGEVLVFVDYQRSEPELLIPYGATRFASKAGPLEEIQFSSSRKTFHGWSNAGARFSCTVQWSCGSVDRLESA